MKKNFLNESRDIMKPLLVFVLIALLALVFSGCSNVSSDHADEIGKIVEQYKVSPQKALANHLSEIIVEINKDRETKSPGSLTLLFKGRLLSNELLLIKPIVPILIQEGEFDLIFSINESDPLFDSLLSDDDYKTLQADYHGDDSRWDMHIAEWLVENNLMKSAYIRAVHAALKDPLLYASRVRGLLAHYGCMAEDTIWVELSSNSTSNLAPAGSGKYPEIPVTEKYQTQLPELRKKLRLGEPPELLPSCPINLYE